MYRLMTTPVPLGLIGRDQSRLLMAAFQLYVIVGAFRLEACPSVGCTAKPTSACDQTAPLNPSPSRFSSASAVLFLRRSPSLHLSITPDSSPYYIYDLSLSPSPPSPSLLAILLLTILHTHILLCILSGNHIC